MPAMVSAVDDAAEAAQKSPHTESAARQADSRAGGSASSESLLAAVLAQLHLLFAAALHYVSVQRDLAKARAHDMLWRAGAAAAVWMMAFVAAGTAVVLVLRGLAHGLGQVFGGREWAGELSVGAFVLLVLAAVVFQAL